MSGSLERNICKTLTPGTEIDAVGRGEAEKFVPEDLQYACRYWIQHLVRIHVLFFRDKQIQKQVYEFLKNKFLYWLEAVSLMGELAGCIRELTYFEALINEVRLPLGI